MTTANSVTILDKIVAQKRVEIAKLPARSVSADDIRHVLEERPDRRDFLAALRHPRRGDVALIAEVKKASPSAGLIRPDFDPVAIARDYQTAGASCLSVLTDEQFFQGSLDYLRAIRSAVSLPLLRKDFVIDDRQVLEAAEWGADAILLIIAILSDQNLRRLHTLASDGGLSVLVEVHDEEELERAVAIDPKILGVNNRNLKTFTVDLATTERLAARCRSSQRAKTEALLVAESGIHTRADVARLARCGAKAILVGESLMRHADLVEKTRELLG